MPPNAAPEDPFHFHVDVEKCALDDHFALRNVPPRSADRLMLAC